MTGRPNVISALRSAHYAVMSENYFEVVVYIFTLKFNLIFWMIKVDFICMNVVSSRVLYTRVNAIQQFFLQFFLTVQASKQVNKNKFIDNLLLLSLHFIIKDCWNFLLSSTTPFKWKMFSREQKKEREKESKKSYSTKNYKGDIMVVLFFIIHRQIWIYFYILLCV